MNNLALLRVAREPVPLRVAPVRVDPHVQYWRAALTNELTLCDELEYARTLRRMLSELADGWLVLPRRCRSCAYYFDQPMPPIGVWRVYCSKRCRNNFKRKVL
jgi:hypothetical protein